jgi:hypothetical protein
MQYTNWREHVRSAAHGGENLTPEIRIQDPGAPVAKRNTMIERADSDRQTLDATRYKSQRVKITVIGHLEKAR